MKKNLFRLFSVSLMLMLALQAGAQQVQPIPLDPKIRYGKLDNGLTYYIRANAEPKQRAEFFIAQNVGSILENDNQNGLAHFLEHMAFNGTKNFPGKGVISFLEKHGVKFGENINAYTALDETVYNLSDVPTIQEGVVDSALLVLHDWSSYITLDDKEIDSERGVIMEEWRTRFGADRRMWKESNKIKYPGSQYGIRDGIGDTAVIKHFKYDVIRDYYKKWYRPDLQAILVVGDIDVDKIEAKIKTLFSSIPKKENAGERPIYTVADNDKPIVALVSDKEANVTRITLEYKHEKLPAEIQLSVQGYAKGIADNLISTIIGERFNEITQQANAPFVGAMAGYGELVKSKDAFTMLAVPREGKEAEGLNALLLEAEKIKRFGFTNAELERAKTNMLKQFETSYKDRDHRKNNSLVTEYVRNFLHNEPVPGIEWEYQTIQAILPNLTVNVINQVAKSYITEKNLLVTITSPEKPTVKVPNNDQVLAAITEAGKAQLTAKAEETLNKPLVEKAPVAGKVIKKGQNPKLGTTEWTLSNGVRVIFKPTTFKQDEILLSAYSEGGLSKVKDISLLPSATLASTIVGNNGLGSYSQVDLNKILTGKVVSVQPQITNYEEGFGGKSSVNDFETMMQLVYLYYTAPRKDDNAFSALINMYRTSLANSATDPRKAFSDTINTLVTNRNPRTVIMNLNTITKVDQDKALAFFKERFANPADFTFILAGNVDPNNVKVSNAICTYLGGLKTTKVLEKFTDNNIRKPQGKVSNTFEKDMKTAKASNLVLYNGAMPYNIVNNTLVGAIGDILDIRYTESIREKEGGTYGVGVRAGISHQPIDNATLLMQFDTDPAKQAKLIGMIYDEVNEIVKNGPKTEDVQKVKQNLLKTYNENLRENGWWLNTVESYYHNQINYVDNYKNAVEAITPQSIQSTLAKLVSQGNVMEVVMKPTK
ncbi:peptidase M16 domain protein [Paludibacter propionicigenes WB4]|uniref:Peptidase M16 domain protein n=1 Tax=Paludibacter propionicigenes (strain DSM 17365 / JCM 13257 / WB4) TaxID=694427 RepID=E4T739_PALPW|nr:M16 family metallopeptidase [Paludibacter propionicigenes]ADQ80533.1 peptidase M16 domain protein [Paludibacter propionicigenes WB4]